MDPFASFQKYASTPFKGIESMTGDTSAKGRIAVQKIPQRQRTRKSPHKFMAYAPMYVSFLVSMMATEWVYCHNNVLKAGYDFEETPTCKDEMWQMLQDPSMHVGIIAMTWTTLVYNNIANQKMKLALIKALKWGAKKPYKVLQMFNQNFGMGLGMSVQNIVTGTYNNPGIPQCYEKIKEQFFKFDNKDNATEAAMESEECRSAYDNYVNLETGTASEINIAIISLMTSSVITGVIFSTLKVIVMIAPIPHKAILFAPKLLSRIKAYGKTANFMFINHAIEHIDRMIEKYIRSFYHRKMSNWNAYSDFDKLYKGLRYLKKNNTVIRKFCPRQKRFCKNKPERIQYSVPILNAIKDYKESSSYRRRAVLSTFIEAQTRWKQKLAKTLETSYKFNEFIKIIFDIREQRKLNQEELIAKDFYYNTYAGLNFIEVPKDYVSLDIKTKSVLSDIQRTELKSYLLEALSYVTSKNAGTSTGIFNRFNLENQINTLVDLLNKNSDSHRLRTELWALKSVLFVQYKYLIDHPKMKNLVYFLNPLSSFDYFSAKAYMDFESKGLKLALPFEKEEGEEEKSVHSSKANRKGVNLSGEDINPLELKLKEGSDLNIGETDVTALLAHSLCNTNADAIYNFNPGSYSTIHLPNLLQNPEEMICHLSPIRKVKTRYLNTDYFINVPKQEVKHLLLPKGLSKIFRYEDRDYIGLLDVITDPSVPLRWENVDDFATYWKSNIQPELFKLLTEAREDYYTLVFNEFHIFDDWYSSEDKEKSFSEIQESTNKLKSSGVGSSQRRNFRKRIQSTIDVMDGLTYEELTQRYENPAFNKRYYTSLSLGRSFLDQVRTAIFILTEIGSHQEVVANIKRYHYNLEMILRFLDISKTGKKPYAKNMVFEDLYREPTEMIWSPEQVERLHNAMNETSWILRNIRQFLEQQTQSVKDLPVKDLTEEGAKLLIAKEVISSLEEAFNEDLKKEIFIDYLSAENFLYSNKKQL